MTDIDRVLIFDVDVERGTSLVEALKPWGLKATLHDSDAASAWSTADVLPSVVLLVEPGEVDVFSAERSAARSRRIPVFAVFVAPETLQTLPARSRDYDDWAMGSPQTPELATRVLNLMARARTPSIDPSFLALMVHDLRTPLNVIGLTIRAISQSVPVKTPDFEEDLTFLQDNAKQIEKMLAQLGDFCRLLEIETPPIGVDFDLCRFLSDFVEDRTGRSGVGSAVVQLNLQADCPHEVSLDPNRTRMALQHAVSNAVTAAGDQPVRIDVEGEAGKVRIAIVVDRPPPSTVQNTNLRPDLYERLAGSAAERRGLDLAIAAGISELFGGSARIEVEAGKSSSIILEWPARIPSLI